MTSQLVPQTWWKPWQWILAAVVIVGPPIVSSYLTTLSINKSRQESAIKTQQRAWINSNDLQCYAENFTRLNNSAIKVKEGYAMASLICPSGNVLLQVKNSDSNIALTWFSFEDIISHQNILVANNNQYAVSGLVLAESPFQGTYSLVAQNIPTTPIVAATQSGPKDTKVCSNIKNNILTLIIHTSSGRCIKQKINIATGEVIERIAISCSSPSCI